MGELRPRLIAATRPRRLLIPRFFLCLTLPAILAAAPAVMAQTASPAPAATPPLSAYARLPAFEYASVSPDGARVAMIETNGEARRVRIRTFGGETLAVLDAGRERARFLDWAGPDHLLLVTRALIGPFQTPAAEIPRQEGNVGVVYDIGRRRLVQLLKNIPGLTGAIQSTPRPIRPGGSPAVIVRGLTLEGGNVAFVPYQVDAITGRAVALGEGGLLTRPDGEIAARTLGGVNREWRLQLRRGERWVDVARLARGEFQPALLGFGRDGRSLLVSSGPKGEDGLFEISPETGTWNAPLPDAVGVPPMYFDRASDGRLLAALDVDGKPLIYDSVLRSAWATAGRSFRGKQLKLDGFSDDRRTILLRVSDPDAPESSYVLDLDAKRADRVGDEQPDLPVESLARSRAVAFSAADGAALTGRLTVPRGQPERSLPLVVLARRIYGVKHAPDFDWIAQALASRGYAVLEVDSRNSAAGRERDGDGQFGRKLQTDLSDGVRSLAQAGVVDPARVCIVGLGDGGGYAAVAGVTVQTGIYRCAVALDPLTDLRRELEFLRLDTTGLGKFRYADTLRLWGAEGSRDDRIEAVSPILHVGQGRSPVLLLKADQAETRAGRALAPLQAGLRRAGRTADLVVIPDGDPSLSREAARLRYLNETVAFLEKHNPPD